MEISKLLAEPLPSELLLQSPKKAASTKKSESISPDSPSRKPSKSSSAPKVSKGRRCTVCGGNFVSKSHLNIHHRTVHLGIKAYQCDICHRRFGQAGTLTRHKSSVHDKVKNHYCTFTNCESSFSSRWSKTVHIRTVHEKRKPYYCSHPACNRRFGNMWNRRKHESHVHGIGIPPGSSSSSGSSR